MEEFKQHISKIHVKKNISIMAIGDIHEHPEQFNKIINEWDPSDERWVVSVGDVFDKGFGTKAAEKITQKLMDLNSKGIGFAVKGNHELKQIRKNRKNLTKELRWWQERPLSICFSFENGSTVTVLHAGVTPKTSQESLKKDIEICYVRDIDENGKMIPLVWKKDNENNDILVKAKEGGYNWHDIYDGRFGYIVSGHAAQKDGLAKFYNYSCNIDSGVFETGVLTGQVFNSDGSLGKTIIVTGKIFK